MISSHTVLGHTPRGPDGAERELAGRWYTTTAYRHETSAVLRTEQKTASGVEDDHQTVAAAQGGWSAGIRGTSALAEKDLPGAPDDDGVPVIRERDTARVLAVAVGLEQRV